MNHSIRNYLIRNYLIRNYSIRNYSIRNHSIRNYSMRDYSIKKLKFIEIHYSHGTTPPNFSGSLLISLFFKVLLPTP